MRPAFDSKELEITGYNPALRYGEKGIPVFNRPISPKENLELLFEGKTPYWMPVVGMRGWDVENAAVALIDEDEQEGVHRLFSQLCDMYDKMIEKAKQYYDIDMVLWHDDWGTQRSTFFSPAVHREMILPYLKRIIESCHSRNLRFELHSCGLNESMVPLMIEAGVDMWCGQGVNDFDKLAHQYKDEPIIFGIPCPAVAPGTPADELARIAEKLVKQYEGCRVAINCLFEFANLEMGNAIYEASRKAYMI